MLDEIGQGHGAVERDRKPDAGQGRAAPVEEVVVPPDPVPRHAQNVRPGGRQPPFGRRHGPVVVVVTDIELGCQRRERFAVDLAVRGKGQAVAAMVEGGGDHVQGQGLRQPPSQDVGRQRPSRVEGHQTSAPVGPLGNQHRGVADARHPQQNVLDLADFDAETRDLDLGIAAPEVLQLAVGQPAASVAAAIKPLTRAAWVGGKGRPGALGIVDVPAADTDAREDDLTGRAERDGGQVLVHDGRAHVADGTAERDPGPIGRAVHDLVIGVVRRLGEAIGVDQRDPGTCCEPALHELVLQRFAGGRHTP